MRTNILAPVKTSETASQFYLNGRIYEMTADNVTMVENTTDLNFGKSIAAFETFEFNENQIKWYLGTSRFTYNVSENKFSWGTSEVLGESFSKHIFAAGAIRYENLKTAELFESLPSLLESYAILDMVACFEGNNISVDLIKTEKSIFVHRVNNSNKIEKFFEAKNANEALEYVKEQTGEDASKFLSSLLEGEAAVIAENNAKIEEYKATIAFLKDQRNVLAEANRNLPEIKEADNYILSEIKSWEDKIAEINN